MESIVCAEKGVLLLGLKTKKRETCHVRSETASPCTRPATVRLEGVLFCEICAHEQEMYFAIGEFTEADDLASEGNLAVIVDLMKKRKSHHQAIGSSEPNAA